MAVYSAFGTKLTIGANGVVAELTSISGLELSADTIETTTHDSTGGFRTFASGLKDAGEVSVEGYFDPDDTDGQIALKSALISGASTAFKVTFPTGVGAEWTFNGIVTQVSTGANMEENITFAATIKVSGVPTLTVA